MITYEFYSFSLGPVIADVRPTISTAEYIETLDNPFASIKFLYRPKGAWYLSAPKQWSHFVLLPIELLQAQGIIPVPQLNLDTHCDFRNRKRRHEKPHVMNPRPAARNRAEPFIKYEDAADNHPANESLAEKQVCRVLRFVLSRLTRKPNV